MLADNHIAGRQGFFSNSKDLGKWRANRQSFLEKETRISRSLVIVIKFPYINLRHLKLHEISW